MKISILLFLVSGLTCQCFCQSKATTLVYPEVGKPMPNFILDEVQYFPRKKVTLNDFHGKWLVLDWWTQYCTSCIESFPKVDALQREFKDKIQFMLIAHTGSMLMGSWSTGDKKVRAIYERSRKTLDLTLPIAYDSLLYQKFNLGTTPYIVVIDPDGIVRAITIHLTSKDISALLEGKQVVLEKAYRRDEQKPELQAGLPFLTYDNGGSDTSFIFRTLLTQWRPGMPSVRRGQPLKGSFELFARGLQELFQFAYTGNSFRAFGDSLYGVFSEQMIINTRDSGLFDIDVSTGKGLYCYSLNTPMEKLNKKYIMETMQRDLKTFFDFNVDIETRILPYYKVVANDAARLNLKTTSKDRSVQYTKGAGYVARKISMKWLLNDLWSYFQHYPPFIDETGITNDFDLTIDATMTDFSDYKRALNKYGIDFVKGEKEMKVLVIRDRKI